MIEFILLIILTALETTDIASYLEVINVLARICSTLSKEAGQSSCRLILKVLTYFIPNRHIYYPFYLKKVGLSDWLKTDTVVQQMFYSF